MSEQTHTEPGDGFKLLTPHRAECYYRDEEMTFVVHRGQRFDLTRNGRARGSTMWHTFGCNDPDCPAILGVRWDTLARFLDSGLAGSDRKDEG